MKKKKTVTVIIHFEDNNQDFLEFTAEFDKDLFFGQITEVRPFQENIWGGMYILSGEPKVNKLLKVSKGPDDRMFTIKHKISKVEYPKAS